MGFLISVLKTAGHTVYFSDEYLKPSTILDSDFLTQKKIDWVGIYANTICYQNTLLMLMKLQKLRVDGSWNGKIMLGGPHTSVGLETIPDYVDRIVIGEGEISIGKLVSGEINKRVIRGERVEDLDSLPFPAWEEFIYRPYNWHAQWLQDVNPVYTFNTSRGCPYNCAFCSVNAVWGLKYRFMSAARIIDDIERMIKSYGLRGVYFREDHFTLNKKRTVDFCEKLLSRNLGIEWICESRADQLTDPAYVSLMARAGCRAFYIGVESGSPRMLEFMRKQETVDQFVRAFDLARKNGIKTYASFVVGAPTETQRDRELTRKLVKKIMPDFISNNIYVGLPGSAFYDYVRENHLYEHEDCNGLLYLKGHDRRVDKYYRGNPYFKIPRPVKRPSAFRRCAESLSWRGKYILQALTPPQKADCQLNKG